MIFSWSLRMANHIGIEKRSKLILKGSSGEYWAMGESLTQSNQLCEEGFFIVKH